MVAYGNPVALLSGLILALAALRLYLTKSRSRPMTRF